MNAPTVAWDSVPSPVAWDSVPSPACPVWTYWEGPRPACIDLCLETLARYNPTLRVVDPAAAAELGAQDVLNRTAGLPLAYRADLMRFWLLRQFGGVWLDADSIALAPLDFLPDVADHDAMTIHDPANPHKHFASPIACRAGSPVAVALYDGCCALIDRARTAGITWGASSTGLLSELYADRWAYEPEWNWVVRQHWRYNRVPWKLTRRVLLGKGKHRQREEWNPNACLYHLTNVVPHHYAGADRAAILSDNTFAAFLFQLALDLPPAVGARTSAILAHLPNDRPLIGAEVGVYRAVNARALLERRRQLTLFMVDPWDALDDPTYNATGDHQTRYTCRDWKRIYQGVLDSIQFAKPRAQPIRAMSAKAAATIADASLDFVFIDANHSEPAVRADLSAWTRKVKPGGWIGGHDYHHKREGKGYGVTAAVDAVLNNRPLLTGADTTWFVYV